MKKFKISVLANIIGVLILTGCDDTTSDSAIQNEQFEAPYMLNCDAFEALPSQYEGVIFTTSCDAYDKDQRDLSSSTYRYIIQTNTGQEVVEGKAISSTLNETSTSINISLSLPEGSEGSVSKLCVTPKTSFGNNNIGTEECYENSNEILAYDFPTVEVSQLGLIYDDSQGQLSVRVNQPVTANFILNDEDGRNVKAQLQWYRSNDNSSQGSVIDGATDSTYLPTDEIGSWIYYSVTPVAEAGSNNIGDSVFSNRALVIDKYNEQAPIAIINDTTVTGTDGIDLLPLPGNTLTFSYQYNQSENHDEEGTVATLYRISLDTGENEYIQDCESSTICEYEILDSDVSYKIEYRVIPKTVNGTVGDMVTQPVDIYGTKISGKMEYLQDLELKAYGYNLDPTKDITWIIDTKSNLINDKVNRYQEAGLPALIGSTGILSRNGSTFEISPANGLRNEFFGEGIISDKAWNDAIASNTPAQLSDGTLLDVNESTVLNASNFIGKEIAVCITINEQTACTKVSSLDSVDSETKMRFVSETYSKDGVLPASVRSGISPINELIVVKNDNGVDFIHHRPFTALEGFDHVNSTVSTEINGIKWAQFRQQAKLDGKYNEWYKDQEFFESVRTCKKIGWELPVVTETPPGTSKMIINAYEDVVLSNGDKINNKTVLGSEYKGMISLARNLEIALSADKQISPATGWPVPYSKLSNSQQLDGASQPLYFSYGGATVYGGRFMALNMWDTPSNNTFRPAYRYNDYYSIISCVSTR